MVNKMKNKLDEMTAYEKDSFIDTVEVTLDYNESVSDEDYALYEELIKERGEKREFEEVMQVLEECKEIPEPYKGTSGENDTRLKKGEAEIALEMEIPIYAVDEAEGYHGSDAGFHHISRIKSKEELIHYTDLLSGYRNMAILQPNYPEEAQRIIANYLRDVYEQKVNNENKRYVIEEGRHTKTNEKLWLVKINDDLEREEFLQEKQKMKELGGYYSKYTHSFVFKEDPTDKLKKDILKINRDIFQINTCEEVSYYLLFNLAEYHAHPHDTVQGVKIEKSDTNSITFEVSGYEHDDGGHESYSETKTWTLDEINRDLESICLTHYWSNRTIKYLKEQNQIKMIGKLEDRFGIPEDGRLTLRYRVPYEDENFNKLKNPDEVSYVLRVYADATGIEKRYNQLFHQDENKKITKELKETTEGKKAEDSNELPFEEWKTLGVFSQAGLVHDLETELSIPDEECVTSYFGDMGEYEFKYGLSEQEIFERYKELREMSKLQLKHYLKFQQILSKN